MFKLKIYMIKKNNMYKIIKKYHNNQKRLNKSMINRIKNYYY